MESLGVEKDRLTKEVEAESVAYCVCSSFGLDTSDYSFPYIAGWSSSREMKEMKASMDVIRKTAGEMIDQLTEELEIILEEKQKTELHDKYGILVDALEAAGYRYDYRESEPGHIVLASDGLLFNYQCSVLLFVISCFILSQRFLLVKHFFIFILSSLVATTP